MEEISAVHCCDCHWIFAQGIRCKKVCVQVVVFVISNTCVGKLEWETMCHPRSHQTLWCFDYVCFKSRSHKKHNGRTKEYLLLHKSNKMFSKEKKKTFSIKKYKWQWIQMKPYYKIKFIYAKFNSIHVPFLFSGSQLFGQLYNDCSVQKLSHYFSFLTALAGTPIHLYICFFC